MVETTVIDNLLTPRQSYVLKGQSDAEEEFFTDANADRLHHAWLISGPKGVGKATLAYRIARYMLAKNSSEINPTNNPMLDLDDPTPRTKEDYFVGNSPLYLEPEHPIFRRVANGTHSDLLTIERGVDASSKKLRKDILVDDVRGIGSFLHKTAAEAIWRVVVIDAMDEMTTAAANALLKVLEEPPNRVLFLLVSHNPGSLLATIRSRCRQLALKPLNPHNFQSIIEDQNISIDADELAYLFTVCNGSIGLARELIESDGSEIFKLTNSVLTNSTELDIQSLNSLCDYFTKQTHGNSFWILRLILNHWITETVKRKVINDPRMAREIHKWIEVWEQMNNLFHKAESVNLGRKQVILNTFFAIAAVARDHSNDANQNNTSYN